MIARGVSAPAGDKVKIDGFRVSIDREWFLPEEDDWCTKLIRHPESASLRDWERIAQISREMPICASRLWVMLLSRRPQFVDKCDFSSLTSADLAWLIGRQPDFADRCDWTSFDGSDWVALLVMQPRFADRCSWDKLEGDDWYDLLLSNPQFALHCDWKKLQRDQCDELIRKFPELARFAADM